MGAAPHTDVEAYIATFKARGGFLREADVEVLARCESSRLMPVLVPCGGGRFTCPMQDVKHFVEIIESHAELSGWMRERTGPADGTVEMLTRAVEAGDYVRDVSFLAVQP